MLVLDTHVWLWLNNEPAKLSAAAAAAIEDADSYGVATVSCWELAMLTRRGRLAPSEPVGAWIRKALAAPGAVALPLTAEVAVEAGLLGEDLPGGPADRMIYATARSIGATLLTRDARLREYDPRGTLW